jgi:hypothetical protein
MTMAADPRLVNLRGAGRRDFVKWSATVAALLGIERARFLDVLFDRAGSAMADTAACAATAKSVHLIGNNGGLAWFTQLFPYPGIAKAAGNGSAALYSPSITPAKTDVPAVYTPVSPFQKLGSDKQVSVFVCGTNQTHTKTPTSGLQLGSNGLVAAVSAIQGANPTLLPVMAINPFVFGVAPGAPAPATVASASGLVGLFNSAASRTVLSTPQTADLHEVYYKAFLGLNAASPRPQVQRAYATGRVAANLLGKNLSEQLQVTPQDEQRYGVGTGSPTTLLEIAHALCTAVKAFKLGLTSCLVLPAMQDDPHGAFQSMATLQSTVKTLGTIFDAFMADCALAPDPAGCSGKTLADSVVLTVSGDTPKDGTQQSGWPDGTAQNHNLLFAMGNGWLKTGFFGDLDAQGNLTTWDPDTGKASTTMTSQSLGTPAAAAVAYAVAKGDARRIQDFGATVPPGITVAKQQ